MDNPHEQGDLLRPSAAADSSASVEQLRSQCQQLQSLFVVALAALLLLGMVSCLFIFKQWRMVRAQVEDQRPSVQRMWTDYQNGSEKLIRNFVGSLQNFAAQHRDFQPILDRYREPLRPYLTPSVPAPPPK
jgi:hypothetical protein